MNTHQQHQLAVISTIEEQVHNNSLNVSVVDHIEDYRNDNRICLTNVHFPSSALINATEHIIDSLKEIEPSYYYYPQKSLHMTIKNVRVIHNPPQFTEEDIQKVEKVLTEIVPKQKSFHVYFYRLLVFKNSLSLIGTTDPELDEIIFRLDKRLREVGIPDDKTYANTKYFFSNMTLARFPNASNAFIKRVKELSNHLTIQPYTVDSVSLVSGNAAFTKLRIIKTWKLFV